MPLQPEEQLRGELRAARVASQLAETTWEASVLALHMNLTS